MNSQVGFRLAYFDLTLAYPKGQLDTWNGVSPNIVTFVLLDRTYVRHEKQITGQKSAVGSSSECFFGRQVC